MLELSPAGAASETRISAETVLAASEAVAAIAGDLRAEVDGFLQKVTVQGESPTGIEWGTDTTRTLIGTVRGVAWAHEDI